MVHPGDGGGQGQPSVSSGSNIAAPSKTYTTRAKLISVHGEGGLQIRDSILNGLVDRQMAHMSGNGGKCKPGFQKGLLDDVTKTAPQMNIKIDDIKNAVRKRRREEATTAQQDAPTIASTTSISTADPNAAMHISPPIDLDTAINPTMGIPPSISNLTTTTAATSQATRTISPDTTPLEFGPAISIPATATATASANTPAPVPAAHTIILSNTTSHGTVAIPSDVNTTASAPSVLYTTTTTDPTVSNTTNTTLLPISSNTSVSEQTIRGRPKGSTNESKQAYANAVVLGINQVVTEYATLLTTARSTNKRLKRGTLSTIVDTARCNFELGDEFNVTRQLINHRLNVGCLEVVHRGVKSPLALPETVLKAMIIAAAELNAPISVQTTITLMNNLVQGTKYEDSFTAFKVSRGMKASNPRRPLIGTGWYKGFRKRNIGDICAKVGKKYAMNRKSHCHYSAFAMMYNQVENLLLESGNAVKYNTPMHMDMEGNIVDDESRAFGTPVSLNLTRPENIFVLDETGDNTHGKEDAVKGGQKMMCLKGQVPREEVGVSDRHFTVVPVTDLTGRLRAYAIIFKGDVLDATWPLGIDIDMIPIVGDILENMGPGKAMPGISVFDDDGKEIPVIFAASENASMTTSVLADIFRKMDLLGITQRGFNADGTPFGPAAIIDGHVSRMGEPFLVYISDDGTRWYVVLGAPYGTALWQVHDDTRENGQFKMELASAKSALFQKKRVKGFDPNLGSG